MGDSNAELEWFSGCEYTNDEKDKDHIIITHKYTRLKYITLKKFLFIKFSKALNLN